MIAVFVFGGIYVVGVVACIGILFGLGRAGDTNAGLGVLLAVTWPVWIVASVASQVLKRLRHGKKS